MAYLDDISQKRQNKAGAEAESAKTQSVIDAIKQSGGDTKDSVTSAMHDLLLATLVAKDPRLAQVSGDLGKLIDDIARTSDNLKDSSINTLPDLFKRMSAVVEDLPRAIASTDKSPELIPYLENIAKVLRSKNTSPSVTVEPTVNVDLKPLEDILRKFVDSPKKGIDFTEYRAQDLANDGEVFQYVGFLKADGGWYIIENDAENNQLRYKFGTDGYEEAWKNYMNFEYKLMDAALNALSA